ncbi:PB1 domain, RWP-RK domain, Lambda repressor-like, DNA-binding domain protein [Artemisia annua]|uniref:PB1 domain, RWP-RK domain, Lambda repressor-like, DNA-binding domain protein n=1 Tax=Artemisia annua TaxID=35608 RepID=A0A2U1MCQ1_ARTAN|nr:PB1 domain, RWP-RK domain, Lambda repressor-like, DNA-binding domain protein [Artemisia annua]
MVRFSFELSDGFIKLEEEIATRFQLKLGSFSLKYEDEDDDMILIACDSSLSESVDDFRLCGQTVIRLVANSIAISLSYENQRLKPNRVISFLYVQLNFPTAAAVAVARHHRHHSQLTKPSK